ncbi:hypothetical protein LC605_32750, partial [Nostoc sp. CHAB 5836]|uniref:hypothetical protein n=1 Tax=Nostoc sp. CHAB 5836 TaxID=2780404 RepID=UPI001E3106FD
FWGSLINKTYHRAKAISFFIFPKKRYRTLLFFSDRKSFRSTDVTPIGGGDATNGYCFAKNGAHAAQCQRPRR